jgi:hypothetical protein
VNAIDPYKLKYFDEAGFVLPGVGKPNYGHLLVNTACVEVGRHVNSPNVTLNMLIGLEGLLCANTEDVILGNCSTRHSEGGYALAEWLSNLGVEVIYLPELNPIELAFNKLKKIMHQDEKRRVFARNIHEGVQMLGRPNCRGLCWIF